jgi:transcriptional regulator with XRE-family HTH domain
MLIRNREHVKRVVSNANHGPQDGPVARRRALPPKTPFGAWLSEWLDDHPGVTHAAFAQDVGVSKGLISQWTAGDVKRIGAPNLAAVARTTGEPLDNLERLLYGNVGTRRASEEPGITLSRDELQAMMDGAADKAVRTLMAELAANRGE